MRTFFSIVCIIGAFGYSKALLDLLWLFWERREWLLAFFGGGLGYALLWMLHLSKRQKFWSIFEHEMTHALFALLFLKRIHSFSANRNAGGSVEIEGDNFMIALSPYFFPLLSVAVIIFKPAFAMQYQWLLNVLLGFTLMFHFFHLTREFHPAQSDLQANGMLFSLIVVVFFNIFFLGLAVAALPGDWPTLLIYLQTGLQASVEYVERCCRFMLGDV